MNGLSNDRNYLWPTTIDVPKTPKVPVRSRLGKTIYAISSNYKSTNDFKNECISTPALTILHALFRKKLLSIAGEKSVQTRNQQENGKHHDHNQIHNHSHIHQNPSNGRDSSNDVDCDGLIDNTEQDDEFIFDSDQFDECDDENGSHGNNNNNHRHHHHHHQHHHGHSHFHQHQHGETPKYQMAPNKLHPDLWYNEKDKLNDAEACKCSRNARKTGIRHGIFPGEEPLESCDPYSNNADRLYHYSVHIEPTKNFVFDQLSTTTIDHNNHRYKFEGFSLLSHQPLTNLPCRMIRFNIEYTIELVHEEVPPNYTIDGLELFKQYLFHHILELYDLDWRAHGDDNGCPLFHIYPRFARQVSSGVKELLSIDTVLDYLIRESNSLVDEANELYVSGNWERKVRYKNMIVWAPDKRPAAVRIDQIDIDTNDDGTMQPVIIHFGLGPPQLSPQYQRAWKELLKYRHLLANKPKVSFGDKQTLAAKEEKLSDYRAKAELKSDTITLPCHLFLTTGLFCDIVQHAMVMPIIVYQIRFQHSLEHLEKLIGYTFKDKNLLQLALTHPSYRDNYGTNPDQARNTLNNLSFRQHIYGNDRVNCQTRKRGINTLFNIMSRFGCQEETMSNIQHNERLEFLGDAVVEFLTSIHLYFMFPDLEEGGLATFRAALVQNQHLAILAKKLQLHKFMLYAHGSDLCNDLELRHAMANCFEALMAALFLDAGLDVADRILSNVLFDESPNLLKIWVNYPAHPLQKQNPDGDRHLIEEITLLKRLSEFESLTGIDFSHIRLLARAFTHRSIGFNNLTMGTNQRMEFLGDTVLQLIASEYLYKHFPGHHEGHLSLLRSSLVNNRTQTVVCDDLGMAEYLNHNTKGPLRTKDRADLLEAFIGALYVDGGLEKCRKFCSVCFFPRLEDFIIHQSWNDPKSKLQQCCLTLRSLDSREPDIPLYKVIDTIGPTNTRVYNVAVYFKDRRLATGSGPSIQDAEMSAATNALKEYRHQFPELGQRRRYLLRHQTEQVAMVARRSSQTLQPLQHPHPLPLPPPPPSPSPPPPLPPTYGADYFNLDDIKVPIKKIKCEPLNHHHHHRHQTSNGNCNDDIRSNIKRE